jgi:hypothetical protein
MSKNIFSGNPNNKEDETSTLVITSSCKKKSRSELQSDCLKLYPSVKIAKMSLI